MYSFNVEQSKGDTQNLVIIAMNQLNLDVQGAVEYVGDLIKARIDQYCQEKEMLPSFGSDEVDAQVAKYVKGLEHWVIGVLHWSFDSERYFGAEHQRIKEERIVTLLPVDTSMLPAGDSTIVDADADDDTDESSGLATPMDADLDDGMVEEVRPVSPFDPMLEIDSFCVRISRESVSLSWKPYP